MAMPQLLSHPPHFLILYGLFMYLIDGYLSLEEMTRYMRAVFAALYETSEQIRSTIDVSPKELARITAIQCFADADTDGDGYLSCLSIKSQFLFFFFFFLKIYSLPPCFLLCFICQPQSMNSKYGTPNLK